MVTQNLLILLDIYINSKKIYILFLSSFNFWAPWLWSPFLSTLSAHFKLFLGFCLHCRLSSQSSAWWDHRETTGGWGSAACSHAEPTCCRPGGLTLLEPPRRETLPADTKLKLLFSQKPGWLSFKSHLCGQERLSWNVSRKPNKGVEDKVHLWGRISKHDVRRNNP